MLKECGEPIPDYLNTVAKKEANTKAEKPDAAKNTQAEQQEKRILEDNTIHLEKSLPVQDNMKK